MRYSEATPINKLRAIAAYCGNFVWDCLSGEDQAKWFTHKFTDEDALRVLSEWEEGMDIGYTGWRADCETTYQEYLNGATGVDGRS